MLSRRLKTYIALFFVAMLLPEVMLAWRARHLVCQGFPDFTIFYSAARIIRYGSGSQLYDEATQLRVQREFVTGVTTRDGPLPYNHPPFEALLFIPFTYLPYCAAFVAWDLVNFAILAAVAHILRPELAVLRSLPAATCFLGLVAFPPVFVALLLGQDSLLLLLVVVLAFVAFKKNDDWKAGGWLGLGLFRFHLLLPILFCLFWQRRTRALASFLGVAALLGGVSIVTIGLKATADYPRYVLHTENVMVERSTITPSNMPTLRGLLATPHLSGGAEKAANIFGAVVAIFLVVLTARAWKRSPEAVFNLGFSLCLLATILAAFHGLPHDLNVLILAVMLVANHVVAQGVGGRRMWALMLPAFVLYLTPLQTFLWFRTVVSGLIAIVLLFWFWVIRREIQSGPDAASGASAAALT
jgi:glycosyl transferase family 87